MAERKEVMGELAAMDTYNSLPPLYDRLVAAPNSTNVVDRTSPMPESLDQQIQRGSAEIEAARRYDDEVAMHGRLARAGVKFYGLPAAAGYNDIGRRR